MWVLLAFITAIFTSFKDVCGRKALERAEYCVVAWAWTAFTIPFLFICALGEGFALVGTGFWPALICSGAILSAASIMFFRAIKISDLSLSIPMLAFTPALLLITSPLILGEYPKPLGVIGILLIVFGSYVLNFGRRNKGLLEPFRHLLRDKGARLMLYIAIMYSIGGNIDKIGVLNSSPSVWAFSVNLLVTIVLSIVVFARVKDPVKSVSQTWKILFLMGVFSSIALIAQMYAIRMTIVPYVIAIKRTSVMITVLFGVLLFKERGTIERLVGVVLMIIGVFIISFFATP